MVLGQIPWLAKGIAQISKIQYRSHFNIANDLYLDSLWKVQSLRQRGLVLHTYMPLDGSGPDTMACKKVLFKLVKTDIGAI